jgi:monofunctional biosynthetic peptidoglycan transglycosylase
MKRGRRKKKGLRRIIGWLLKFAVAAVVLSVLLILVLRWAAPPTSAFMIRQRLSGISADYRWVPMNRISPYAALAVIAAEDQNFFKHFGIDLQAVEDAIQERRSRARPRGASTISQQTAKNLFLWPGRSYLRKAIEAYLALIMETAWPKERILEVYLNIVEMGRGVYGVEAAARRFYNKPAAELSRREAATLAAVLPSPRKMFADHPSAYVNRRSREIMQQMKQLGGVGLLKAAGIVKG